jgi:hypothetical protein
MEDIKAAAYDKALQDTILYNILQIEIVLKLVQGYNYCN